MMPVGATCSCLEWRVRNPWTGPGVCTRASGCNLRPRQPERYKIMRAIVNGSSKPVRWGQRLQHYDATDWKRAWYIVIREWYYYGDHENVIGA